MTNKAAMIKKLGSEEAYRKHLQELGKLAAQKRIAMGRHRKPFQENPELARMAGRKSRPRKRKVNE